MYCWPCRMEPTVYVLEGEYTVCAVVKMPVDTVVYVAVDCAPVLAVPVMRQNENCTVAVMGVG